MNGRTVDCIMPEWLVRFHTGYEVDATDWADVSALCARFGRSLRSTSDSRINDRFLAHFPHGYVGKCRLCRSRMPPQEFPKTRSGIPGSDRVFILSTLAAIDATV